MVRPVFIQLLIPQPEFTEDTIYMDQFAPEVVLGLDHVDKSGKLRSGESPLLKLN